MKECPNCKELVGDDVRVCFNCNYNIALKRIMTITEKFQEKESKEQTRSIYLQTLEEERQKVTQQIQNNAVYEYATICVRDETTGILHVDELQNTLKEYSSKGWRLHSVISDEKIKPRPLVKLEAFYQTILIFERCIRKEIG